MTDLSEFLALLQFEVQKSFDFSEQLMHDLADNGDPMLQLAYESVEMDIPLLFEMGTKEITAPTDADTRPDRKPGVLIRDLEATFAGAATRINMRNLGVGATPANLEKPKALRRRTSQKGEESETPRGQTLKVMTPGNNTDEGKTTNPAWIGRIKVTLKPVIK